MVSVLLCAICGRILSRAFSSALGALLSPTDLSDLHRCFSLHPTFRMRKIRAHPSRQRRIKTQAVGSGARVKDP